MRGSSRRGFLRSLRLLPGAALMARYEALAAAESRKTKSSRFGRPASPPKSTHGQL